MLAAFWDSTPSQRSRGRLATIATTKKIRKLRDNSVAVLLNTSPTRNSPGALGAAAEMFAMRAPVRQPGRTGRERFCSHWAISQHASAARNRQGRAGMLDLRVGGESWYWAFVATDLSETFPCRAALTSTAGISH